MPRLHIAVPGPTLLWEGVGCWMQSCWKHTQPPLPSTHAGVVPFPTLFGCAGMEIPILIGMHERKPQCLQDQAHHSHTIGSPSMPEKEEEEEGEAMPLCRTPSPTQQPTRG